MSWVFSLFLILSGMASLTYQVTWVRLLGLSMGSTSASISTVLAAFFLGLALGSVLADRWPRHRIGELPAYLLVEGLIGLSGVGLFPVLLQLDAVMSWLPTGGLLIVWKFTIAMTVLAIPTLGMGATLPLMVSILVRREHDMGGRFGWLYGLNTMGAMLGAVLTGFVLIPNFGLDGAIYIAGGLNLAIALLGLICYRWLAPLQQDDTVQVAAPSTMATPAQKVAPFRRQAAAVLVATGLAAIATEVGWTKYLSIFAGTTVYGFSVILGVVLFGIASGSWAMKFFIGYLRSPQNWLAGGIAVLGATLLLTRAGLSAIPGIFDTVFHPLAPGQLIQGIRYAFVAGVLLPSTLLFGALFPLSLSLYCGDLAGMKARVGQAYALNIVASIAGSLLAGFWLIPSYGTDVLLTIMAFVLLLLPLIWLPAVHGNLPRLGVLAITVVACLSHWTLPRLDYRSLIQSLHTQSYRRSTKKIDVRRQPSFLFFKEGKSGVISLTTYMNQVAELESNGLRESRLSIEDPNRHLLVSETMLSLLPYFFHERPQTAFVVGFGGGTTARTLTYTDLEVIRIVELEPAVVEAVQSLYEGPIPFLQDERVTLSYDDARHTLLVENQTYDIVASQPSHPWVAGAANVFTREFFQLVRSRLNASGMFAQWVNLFHMDATTLRSILQAFYGVFPHGCSFVYLQSGDLILIGSMKPLVYDVEGLAQRMQRPHIQRVLNEFGIIKPYDFLWYFALSRQEALAAAGDVPPNTDTNILSELRLAALHGQPPETEDPYRFISERVTLDIVPYFKPDGRAEQLYQAGLTLLELKSLKRTQMVVTRLQPLDAERALQLEERLQMAQTEAQKDKSN